MSNAPWLIVIMDHGMCEQCRLLLKAS